MIKRLIPGIVKTKLKNICLAGNNVECPICEKTFITFLPFGLPPSPLRPNAQCPNCKSLERTRIFWKYLQSETGLLNSKNRVLHVAPESRLFKKFSNNPILDYHPIDKFTEGYRYPKGTLNMDITNLEFSNEHFDFILCSHVLEHVPDDIKAMSEFYRVMKKGGFGILQVPIDLDREKTYEDHTITGSEERIKAFGQFDHVRIYGMDYFDRLRSVGFEVELNDFANSLNQADKFRFGFGKGEKLFVVKK